MEIDMSSVQKLIRVPPPPPSLVRSRHSINPRENTLVRKRDVDFGVPLFWEVNNFFHFDDRNPLESSSFLVSTLLIGDEIEFLDLLKAKGRWIKLLTVCSSHLFSKPCARVIFSKFQFARSLEQPVRIGQTVKRLGHVSSSALQKQI